MAVYGRPTPQRHPGEVEADDERPRFRDIEEHPGKRSDINPYFESHRTFGPPLLTADQAWRFRGKWEACFGRPAPLHLEIGCGNGFFLAGLAQQRPDVNLLGIEIRYKRTVLCARKIANAGITNARIARYHAAYLDDLFEPGSLHAIYVNHPDPWSKARHEKNRLISRWFLEDVARLLAPGGVFRLKSDHRPNIDRVTPLLTSDADGEPLPQLPLVVTGQSDDVIAGDAPWSDDIETNYQSKFRLRGEPVYAIELVRQ